MRLHDIIADTLKVDPSTLSDASSSSNVPELDSLQRLEMIFAIERAFHTRFTAPEIAGFRTLGDIRRSLRAKCTSVEDAVLAIQVDP